ncbi:energy transducer TonB, partial [Pseudomonas syringae]
MNVAVKMKVVPTSPPENNTRAGQVIPYIANPSRPGGLNKPQGMVLIAASVLIHGVIWWYIQTAQPDVPEVAPQVPEMTIELTSPTPPAPEPPPPEPP